MRLFGLGLLLFIFGIVSSIILVTLGMGKFYLFVIIPVFYFTGVYSLVPILFLITGILLMFFQLPCESGSHSHWRGDHQNDNETHPGEIAGKKKFGGVIMIGPIPLIFGNDQKLVYIAIGAIILLILILFLYYL